MRRRRAIIALAMLAFVAAAAVLLWPRGSRPCLATFEKVQEGMTREQVYATVGGPPNAVLGLPSELEDAALQREEWEADDGLLWIGFSADGRVEQVRVYWVYQPGWRRVLDPLGL
jgi:Flp pilus assembly protein CpaB